MTAVHKAAGVEDVTLVQERRNGRVYIRRTIVGKEMIVLKILLLAKTNIVMDRQAKLQCESFWMSCENLPPAHGAYPLMTKSVQVNYLPVHSHFEWLR